MRSLSIASFLSVLTFALLLLASQYVLAQGGTNNDNAYVAQQPDLTSMSIGELVDLAVGLQIELEPSVSYSAAYQAQLTNLSTEQLIDLIEELESDLSSSYELGLGSSICTAGGEDCVENTPTACTMDAMQCPDGTYVGRTGPNCTFICPGESGPNAPPHVYPIPDFGGDEISLVLSRWIDPIPMAADEEYTLYLVRLSDGTEFSFTVHAFTASDMLMERLEELGYTGTRQAFIDKIEVADCDNPPLSEGPRKLLYNQICAVGDTPAKPPHLYPATSRVEVTSNQAGAVELLVIMPKQSSYGACDSGPQGTVQWGDGGSDVLMSSTCTVSSYIVTIEHEYEYADTYTIRVIDRNENVASVSVGVGGEARPGVIGSFFSMIAEAFNNTFSSVVSFFFPDRRAAITDREFANFPSTGTAAYQAGTFGISNIQAIVINELAGEPGCSVPYEAYVITNSSLEIGLTGCPGGNDVTNYLADIALQLNQNHSFESMTVEELLQLPVYLGNAEAAVENILTQTTEDPPPIFNELDLEVKVADESGTTKVDWTTGNVSVGILDDIHLRWNAEEFDSCLPFFADNGNYILTRQGESLFLSGNTEDEGYNVFERTGLYWVECSQDNITGIAVGSVYVTISDDEDDHGVISHTSDQIAVSVSDSNPLEVTITYTDSDTDINAGVCGPKFVGEVHWGDGTTTPEPTVFTQECRDNESISVRNTYSHEGMYVIRVYRGGELLHREIVSLNDDGSNFSAVPSAGRAPLTVRFTGDTDTSYADGLSLDFGDGSDITGCQTQIPNGACEAMHTYEEPGQYTAKLLGNDENNLPPVEISTLRVTANGQGQRLLADPSRGGPPLSVDFTFSYDGNATLTFGDGSSALQLDCTYNEGGNGGCSGSNTITHVYDEPGSYQARLVTGCPSNASNCAAIARIDTATITVLEDDGTFCRRVPTSGSTGDLAIGFGNTRTECGCREVQVPIAGATEDTAAPSYRTIIQCDDPDTGPTECTSDSVESCRRSNPQTTSPRNSDRGGFSSVEGPIGGSSGGGGGFSGVDQPDRVEEPSRGFGSAEGSHGGSGGGFGPGGPPGSDNGSSAPGASAGGYTPSNPSPGSYNAPNSGSQNVNAGPGQGTGPGGGSEGLLINAFISQAEYDADVLFASTLNPVTLRGYHIWIAPVVSAMERSSGVSTIVYQFFKPWSKEVAYQLGESNEGSLLGKAMMAIGLPLSWTVGYMDVLLSEVTTTEDPSA